MIAHERVRYQRILLPAFQTAGISLLLFGLAHVAFITWVPTASQAAGDAQPPLPLRMLVMFVAPVGFGIVFAALAALLGAAAWREASARGLRSWRYGAVLASALLPPIALSLAHGPYGDDAPPGAGVPLLFAASFLLPALLGGLLAGWRAGLLLALSAMPLVAPWSMFLLGGGLRGWTIPFVASLVLILLASGAIMERRTAARALRTAAGPASAEADA